MIKFNYGFVLRFLLSIGILVWLFISISGYFLYSGDRIYFLMFTVAFTAMLISGVMLKIGFSYLFFVALLWLGFWQKLIVHLILDYRYLEPTGLFNYGSNYDDVLLVSSLGALAVLLTGISCALVAKPRNAINNVCRLVAPKWYRSNEKLVWLLAITLIVGIFLINSVFGMYQLGLMPLSLPWPLTGLMGWLLGFGIPLAIYSLVYWHISSGGSSMLSAFAIFVVALISSISTFSRATYLFHTLPYLIAAFRQGCFKTAKKYLTALVLVLWIVLLALSLTTVQNKRYGVEGGNISSAASSFLHIEINSNAKLIPFGAVIHGVSRLIVDRWIGLEGVMAVVGYPDKGVPLLLEAANDRRVAGELDIYTQRIAKVDPGLLNIKKIQYASIPGPIAFFFYSGSYLILFCGMLLITLFVIYSEKLVAKLINNPYFVMFWAMFVAQGFSSFGLGIKQHLLFLTACFCALLIISFIQRNGLVLTDGNKRERVE